MRVESPNRDRIASRLAGDQHGVVARSQLLAAGVSYASISRSLESGRLHPLFRGVYAVGHSALPREAWFQAALLVGGAEAVLCHHAAADLWRFRLAAELFPISVATSGDGGRKQDRIRVRRMRLHPSELMELDGLRVTTPARTIVDMASELEAGPLRRLVERAQDLRRFHPSGIRAVLGRNPRRPGGRPLADFLALLEPDVERARSHLERLFLALVRSARLPPPEVNVEIEGRRRDFVWRNERLVVEVDGHAYHSSRRAMRRDRGRDRALTAAAWRPARFTYEDVAFTPTTTAAELKSMLRSSCP
jgi:very-short-patch-repair endonuclease